MASMYQTQYHHMALMSTSSSATPTVAPLRPESIRLNIRQQPKEALITTEGKEKARKPIDPPSIVQLTVDPNVDPVQQFLQSPYLFLSVSLRKADKTEPHDAAIEKSLAGTLVSSLHRLKDVSNKDGGFFVFGDISVKIVGKFRLHFSLYEFQSAASEVLFLGSIDSDPFSVVLAKDFKGMEESTYLSRAFSDQGVRLRIRKEPRNLISKRGYSYDDEQQETPIQPNLHSEYSGSYDANSSPNKRYKRETVDRKDSFPEGASAMPQYSQLYTQSPTYPAAYSTPRQTHHVTTPTTDYNHIGMQVQYAGMSGQMGNAYSNRPSYSKNTGSQVYSSPSIHTPSIHDGTNGTQQYTVPSQPTFPTFFPNSYPQSSAATSAVDLLGYTGDAFKATDQRFQQ